MIELFDHQKEAVEKLRSGSLLVGGTGSGKSLTALWFYYTTICGGKIRRDNIYPMKRQKDLYIITTAKKRDDGDWEKELSVLRITSATVDSWNNIKKYQNVRDAFFIFDEQRVVGYGTWSKTFINISKNNLWILLSATPGDALIDYAPVLIANGFYKNITEFRQKHVIYSRFTNYPKIERYINTHTLIPRIKSIIVRLKYEKRTKTHDEYVKVYFDKDKIDEVIKTKWNPYEDRPIRNASEYALVLRRITNSDRTRWEALLEITVQFKKVIVFYTFNYELELIKRALMSEDIPFSEYNGHKHEDILDEERWAYLVQFNSGSEAWECIETNVMIFFSLNHSYKMMTQAKGRIDRLNTPFDEMWYFYLVSDSIIDKHIKGCLSKKQDFNARMIFGSEFKS